jgi:hypothetical protein
MQQKGFIVMAATALVGLAVACGTNNSNQTSPTSPSSAAIGGDAAADGSTLKATAPVLVSPVGGVQLTELKPTLVWTAATGKYVSTSFTYRLQILSATGALLKETTTSGLQYAVTDDPDINTVYQWKVRAEVGTYIGPWSSTASFRSMDKIKAFLRNNELYDPLIDGTTLGKIVGAAHFVPGVGLEMDAEESYVEYTLPQTLREGEFSALITGLGVVSSTEDPKLRLFTMREGWAAINDNIYRMSVDKRGNGAVAWRFISGDASGGAYIETISNERTVVDMHENLTYFYQATWKGGVFNVLIKEGGYNGRIVYNYGKPYKGVYQPSPHNVYIGSPFTPGDRGEPSTCDGMIIRQIWVSPNPRPGTINQ